MSKSGRHRRYRRAQRAHSTSQQRASMSGGVAGCAPQMPATRETVERWLLPTGIDEDHRGGGAADTQSVSLVPVDETPLTPPTSSPSASSPHYAASKSFELWAASKGFQIAATDDDNESHHGYIASVYHQFMQTFAVALYVFGFVFAPFILTL